MEFKRYILGEFISDKKHQRHIKAWRAYHVAAEKVDGHYNIGNIPAYILRAAAYHGFSEMKKIDPSMESIHDNKAKMEALRQLEIEGLIVSDHEKIKKWRR